MVNTADTDAQSLMKEASCRVALMVALIQHVEEPGTTPDYSGYEWAVVREVLSDVATTLKAAAERSEE